jgi:hypothetical protein
MKVLVTESFNTAKGNIPAGKVVEIPDAMFNRLKGKVVAIPPEPGINTTVIWSNPYQQGTPEARQESLLHIMTAILESAFDRVKAIWPQGFLSTPEMRAAEIEIERVRSLVLLGKGRLADFRQAVEAWERVCT